MEKCFRGIVEEGKIKEVLGEISCNPSTILDSWFIYVITAIVVIAISLWLLPIYNIWRSKKSGEAIMAKDKILLKKFYPSPTNKE